MLVIAIQARQLDSLIRLTEARARADLRESATAADARDVIELMKFSLRELFRDSVPFVHVPASGKGVKTRGEAAHGGFAGHEARTGHRSCNILRS